MFTVSSCFIANFKIGDNINYNLATLRCLYSVTRNDPLADHALRKPTIVTLVSVAEAILYDFVRRIQSREHVATLSKAVVTKIKTKKYPELSHLIAAARKHDLFEADERFYEQLDKLRELRNRVHIQNEKRHFEANESDAFTKKRLRAAEEAVEYISKYLAGRHARDISLHSYVADFKFPWNEHYT